MAVVVAQLGSAITETVHRIHDRAIKRIAVLGRKRESWDAKTARNLIAKQAMVGGMLTDVDLVSTDFTKKTAEAVKNLGLKTGKRQPVQRAIMTPEIEQLASQIDLDALMRDPEDEGVAPRSLSQMLDPVAQKELAKHAQALGGTLDVAEEQRVWGRQFDMDAMPSRWRMQEVLLTAAKSPAEKQKAHTATRTMTSQALAWRSQLEFEARQALDLGDTKTANAYIKASDKFTASLPDVFKETPNTDQVIAKINADPELAAPGTATRKPGKPALGRGDLTRKESA